VREINNIYGNDILNQVQKNKLVFIWDENDVGPKFFRADI
jgi:hypothetical protein